MAAAIGAARAFGRYFMLCYCSGECNRVLAYVSSSAFTCTMVVIVISANLFFMNADDDDASEESELHVDEEGRIAIGGSVDLRTRCFDGALVVDDATHARLLADCEAAGVVVAVAHPGWSTRHQHASFRASCGRQFGEVDALLWIWSGQDLDP